MTPTQAAAIDSATTSSPHSRSVDGTRLSRAPEGASTSLGWLNELHDQFLEHSRASRRRRQARRRRHHSSVALRILFAPLLQHTAQKRLTYGRLIQTSPAASPSANGETAVVQWPDILPTNDLEVADRLRRAAAGVSRDVAPVPWARP